jgi:hypothetical protein
MADEQTPVIVNPQGKPARASASKDCPNGHGPEHRVKSSGFGEPHPVCSKCGHEFYGEKVS